KLDWLFRPGSLRAKCRQNDESRQHQKRCSACNRLKNFLRHRAFLLQILFALLLFSQNHRAGLDCPPADASAPADLMQIAAPDQLSQLRRPRVLRSDAENLCPIRRASAQPRPEHAQWVLPPNMAASKCARNHTP